MLQAPRPCGAYAVLVELEDALGGPESLGAWRPYGSCVFAVRPLRIMCFCSSFDQILLLVARNPVSM